MRLGYWAAPRLAAIAEAQNRSPKDNLDLSINGFAFVAYALISINSYAEMLQKTTRDTDVNGEHREKTVD